MIIITDLPEISFDGFITDTESFLQEIEVGKIFYAITETTNWDHFISKEEILSNPVTYRQYRENPILTKDRAFPGIPSDYLDSQLVMVTREYSSCFDGYIDTMSFLNDYFYGRKGITFSKELADKVAQTMKDTIDPAAKVLVDLINNFSDNFYPDDFDY